MQNQDFDKIKQFITSDSDILKKQVILTPKNGTNSKLLQIVNHNTESISSSSTKMNQRVTQDILLDNIFAKESSKSPSSNSQRYQNQNMRNSKFSKNDSTEVESRTSSNGVKVLIGQKYSKHQQFITQQQQQLNDKNKAQVSKDLSQND